MKKRRMIFYWCFSYTNPMLNILGGSPQTSETFPLIWVLGLVVILGVVGRILCVVLLPASR